ncbi:hypothetical protein [Afipia sp. GAS231]|uniref:hypothetical protein n=1 Tax=Afipia sp. GAS231 TaxID=1882747 RepID=UPI00087D88D7|nr:hypothetical protein [Afipia sp. GAS231]SDM94791.1 hypothetical protein SAMN05444050_0256 [Afipia sp. GAS231]
MFRTSRFVATGFLAIVLGATAAMAGQPGRGAESSINPQTLPPRVLSRVLSRVLQQQAGIAVASSRIGSGSRVMINPQPLPPKQNGAYGIR